MNIGSIARTWETALTAVAHSGDDALMRGVGIAEIEQATNLVAKQGPLSRIFRPLPPTTTDAAAIGAALRKLEGAAGDAVKGATDAHMANTFADIGARLETVKEPIKSVATAASHARTAASLLRDGGGRMADGSLHPDAHAAVRGVVEGLDNAVNYLGLTARDGLL